MAKFITITDIREEVPQTINIDVIALITPHEPGAEITLKIKDVTGRYIMYHTREKYDVVKKMIDGAADIL